VAGRPRGKQKRDITVPVRFTASLAAAMDDMRGGRDRSAYIRRLVEEDAARNGPRDTGEMRT
jgi:hypothetical protein